jgi:AraC-like DNA-binding protein
MYRARASAFEGIAQLVRESGENPVALMESIGLSPAQFRDPNQFIAYPKLAALVDACSKACKEPCFGLLLGQRQPTGVLGALPLVASRAATVGDALRACDRYMHLHASGVRLVTTVRGETARLALTIPIGNPPGIDQLLQLSVVQEAFLIAALLNSDPFALSLHLRQPPCHGPAGEGAIRFSRLQFGQGFDGVSIPTRFLLRPNHWDEGALNRHLEDYLSNLQSRYPNRLEEQVADVIGRMLPTGECSLEEVAATLNLRPRTLQAQLSDRGTSYSDLLRDVRYNLARQRLSESDTSITELALHLGYADVAIFSRHFKAWSGLSPRAWRKARAGL